MFGRRAPRLLRQVPLCVFLADEVPALATFRTDDDTSVLDALVDAAEALQVAELQRHHSEVVDTVEQVKIRTYEGRSSCTMEREKARPAVSGGERPACES